MKLFKGILLIIMESILLFIAIGLIYTLYFVDTPLIIIPEYVYQFRTMNVTYGLIISLITALLSTGLLIYHQYKKVFNKKSLYILWFISGYLFLLFQGTLLYGKSEIGNSWTFDQFYIDYFGLYKADITRLSYHFFFDNIVVSILYSMLFLLVIGSIWKGRLGKK